jgi:hypothetical protein
MMTRIAGQTLHEAALGDDEAALGDEEALGDDEAALGDDSVMQVLAQLLRRRRHGCAEG